MKSNDKPRPCIKKQRHHFAGKGLSSQSYGFSSSHVQMWNLNHKEGWAPNNWCFQIVVLEKTLESPLKSKNIKPINPEGNQPWIFTGRADAEAPILWLVDSKSWLIRKDPDIGKDWRQEEKGMTEDKMVGLSLTQQTCVWGRSRTWWRTQMPGVLQSIGSQRVRHDWATE